ncbi:MAG: recombinase family protein [Spirochaetes bacterium]|nr:recombinase family protein [Spirochaetota bacterium]
MKIGYARVSTSDQNLDLQLDALKKAGCDKFFTDKASGSQKLRKGLDDVLTFIRPGDELVIWKLDRLGRSLIDLIKIVNSLKEKNIGFISLQDSIDTSTPAGKLFFHISGAFAEFERSVIQERTMAGLSAARARGRKGGRPKAISEEKFKHALNLYNSKSDTVINICNSLGIKRRTFYQHLKNMTVG